jgi:hypothetical protein
VKKSLLNVNKYNSELGKFTYINIQYMVYLQCMYISIVKIDILVKLSIVFHWKFASLQFILKFESVNNKKPKKNL